MPYNTHNRIGTLVLLLLACLTPAHAQDIISHEAWLGEPFGVGRITFRISAADRQNFMIRNGYRLEESNQRILYPCFGNQRVLGVLREVLGVPNANAAQNTTAYFLFQGSDPLDVTVGGDQVQTVRLQPSSRPGPHRRLLRAWWRQYAAVARNEQRESIYPPLLDSYLVMMLSNRFGFPYELPANVAENRPAEHEAVQLIMNAQQLRTDMVAKLMRFGEPGEPQVYPVPDEIPWVQRNLPLQPEVPLEPLAHSVPDDCFYVRFGSFSNYLWLKGLLEENGGDLGRMVTQQGHNYMLSEKMQTQLGLKENALAKILGNQVIADVAMIGHDTYMLEGASLGMVFLENAPVLKGDLQRQRQEAVARLQNQGATMETVTIAGQEVSFASTPDNQLRSFFATKDKVHLVTTSRHLVERFLLAPDQHQTLADSPEFQMTRAEVPLDRDDTIFLYLSPAFFRNLVSPHYQIELRRRLRAITELEILQMARTCATHEGVSADSPQDLIRFGFLPAGFGKRIDRTSPNWDTKCDSLRGARGTFTPIADVPVTFASMEEISQYRRLEQFHREKWTQMDPLVAAIKRTALDDNKERLVIDARMLPFDRSKYDNIVSVMGPPVSMQVQHAPDDIITAQLSVQGGRLMPQMGPHIMFLGMKDQHVPVDFATGQFLRTLQILRTAPAYFGAWPKLGLLDAIALGPRSEPDAFGFSQHLLGLWRWSSPDQFSVLSFDRRVIEETIPHLQVVDSEYMAQARIHVGDVSQSKIRDWFTSLTDTRAFETSVANTRYFHHLSQQLGVDLLDAKTQAEQLLDTTMECALGGQYVLREREDNGAKTWISTAWDQPNSDNPDNQFPILKWFRGTDAHLLVTKKRLTFHATLDMQRDAKSEESPLPNFNLLKGNPFNLFRKDVVEKEEELPPPIPQPQP
ncbi:MAG: hypothetical protein R3C28_10500 [Pirellulaceae bacterium]